jgi:predicted MPP superfamily phosphohydrolase
MVGSTALLTLGLGAYSLCEPYLYRLTRIRVPVANRAPALTILNISDTHMQRHNRRLTSFLASLPERLGVVPDLVLATGDMIEGNDGIDPLVEGLKPLRATHGCYYVLGSHDYYAPTFKGVRKYFRPPGGSVKAPSADTDRLQRALHAAGWQPLLNSTHMIDTPGGAVRLTGVDDPYIGRHKTDHIEREPGDAAAIGMMHSPDVVSEWFRAGYDLVLAGHTHGGQVRIPGVGALVTNCSLPTSLARGLHRIDGGWLHVSPGLGTGKYSPIRFGCRPEATLLCLDPAYRRERPNSL